MIILLVILGLILGLPIAAIILYRLAQLVTAFLFFSIGFLVVLGHSLAYTYNRFYSIKLW